MEEQVQLGGVGCMGGRGHESRHLFGSKTQRLQSQPCHARETTSILTWMGR